MEKVVKQFDRIVVVGPQRSGTRITAKIISRIAKLPYIDEHDFQIYGDKILERLWKRRGNKGVAHAPALSPICDAFDDSVLIVWCKRDLQDTIKSEKRIKWESEKGEKKRYPAKLINKKDPIAKIRWDYFEKHQRNKIKNLYVSDYEELKRFPEWVPKEQRINFKHSQTKVEHEDEKESKQEKRW